MREGKERRNVIFTYIIISIVTAASQSQIQIVERVTARGTSLLVSRNITVLSPFLFYFIPSPTSL